MDRSEKLLSCVDEEGRGLEIGPNHRPLAPKSRGYNVETLDWLDKESVIRECLRSGLDPSSVEDIDYLWAGERYADLVDLSRGGFDWIIASHVVEHVPDLVAFLRDCEEILNDQGVLVLVVPDKRYCFDRYRPISGLGEVLDRFVEGRTRHSIGTLVEWHLYYSEVEGQGAWDSANTGEPTLCNEPRSACEMFRSRLDKDGYVDCHGWCFVPSSFRLLVKDLWDLDVIGLKELRWFPTEGCEFTIALARHGDGPGVSRNQLLAKVDRELASVWVGGVRRNV
ncbi:bifunctional 2-polyprenyl-6-hydroxyphenol methylase/3-demethylubiquinol 3-O-methyltransferase UbiG [Thioalkalivibrio sp. AKL10]|uniref:class I SAM-dependent methyltransferase n=1 Tax=Thioalkalivibrio sp. AKL10 TaxID=1158158 RepID=UPI0021009564|nr:methyltransferase domain-containing protein [Thioalkalivibrio sp. AKL10]